MLQSTIAHNFVTGLYRGFSDRVDDVFGQSILRQMGQEEAIDRHSIANEAGPLADNSERLI